LVVLVMLLHFGLAVAIKITFFAHGSPATKVPAEAPPAGDGGEGEGAPEKLIRSLLGW